MDGNLAMDDNRRMLMRIIALLYAFAGLAERLNELPSPARGLLLWILRHAEAIAREFVMDTALDLGVPAAASVRLIPALHGGESAEDGMRLAESFRALAALLELLADRFPGFWGMSITRLFLALSACAGPRFGQGRLCLAAPGVAIGRCDSS